jgi:hypothetical protein
LGDKGIFWLNFDFLSWNHLNGGRGGGRENQHFFWVKKQINYHLNGGSGSLRENQHFFCVKKQFAHFHFIQFPNVIAGIKIGILSFFLEIC